MALSVAQAVAPGLDSRRIIAGAFALAACGTPDSGPATDTGALQTDTQAIADSTIAAADSATSGADSATSGADSADSAADSDTTAADCANPPACFNGMPCDDGDPCTVGNNLPANIGRTGLTTWKGGYIIGAGVSNSYKGHHAPAIIKTDHGGHDTCFATGTCIGKKPSDCDDKNACTADWCHAQQGCRHSPVASCK